MGRSFVSITIACLVGVPLLTGCSTPRAADNAALQVTPQATIQAAPQAPSQVAPQAALPDLSGPWKITHGKNKHDVVLISLGNNRYRLRPENLAFHGVYQFDGKTLSMVAENRGYPDLVWLLKEPTFFKMIAGDYLNAVMEKQ